MPVRVPFRVHFRASLRQTVADCTEAPTVRGHGRTFGAGALRAYLVAAVILAIIRIAQRPRRLFHP